MKLFSPSHENMLKTLKALKTEIKIIFVEVFEIGSKQNLILKHFARNFMQL